jgi:ParB-like chromosome segregation protein Spo0J
MDNHSDTPSGTDGTAKTMVDVTLLVSEPEVHDQPTLDLRADNLSVGATNLKAGAKAVQFHPLAEIFPELDNDRLRELAADIKKNGLIDPLVTYEGKILDGRNRYGACGMAGVEPNYVAYTGDDPVGYIVRRNLHRRQLNESQRAMVAAKLANLERGANQHSEGLPVGTASEILNVGRRSVARARNVLKDAIPEVVRAVDSGQIPVVVAEEIARLPKLEQQEALEIKNKKKKKKTNSTKDSTETPASAQLAETAPGAPTEINATVMTLAEAENVDGAALIKFANFILPRIADQADTIVITVTAEDVDEFNILVGRVRSVIKQEG